MGGGKYSPLWEMCKWRILYFRIPIIHSICPHPTPSPNEGLYKIWTQCTNVFPFETNKFENALKEIKTKTHTYCNSVDDRKRIKMKTMTENITKNITGACDLSMRIEFNLRHNVQFNRFLTFEWGKSKTHQNGSVDENRSMRFRGQRISVDRAWGANSVFGGIRKWSFSDK